MFWKPSLVRRIALPALVVTLVPAAVGCLFVWYTGRATLTHEILTRMEAIADSKADLLDDISASWLDNMQALVDTPSLQVDVADLARAALPPHQRDIAVLRVQARLQQLTHPPHAESSVAAVVSLPAVRTLVSVGPSEGFAPHGEYSAPFLSRQHHPWLSQPHRHPPVQSLVVDVVEAIPSASSPPGRPPAAAIWHIPLSDHVIPLVEPRGEIGRTGDLMLLDRQGHVIKQLTQGQPPVGIRYALPNANRLIPAGSPGPFLTSDYRGLQVLASSRQIPTTGWTLVAQMDAAEAYAPVRELTLHLMVAAIGVVLLALVLAYAVAERIALPLRQLSATASAIAGGNLEARFAVEGRDELGTLGRSANVMVERLQSVLRDLESLVGQRTMAVQQANEQLRQSEAALRALTSELSTVEETQRRELAAQLHDTVVQLLGAARMQLKMMAATASEAQRAPLEQVVHVVEEAVAESRGLLTQLSPPLLYEVGLVAALQRLAEQLAAKHHLEVHVEAEREPEPLDDARKGLLFHGTRELLNNVVKHAQATQVEVSVERTEAEVTIEVRDDGVGLQDKPAPEPHEGGFGLFSIRERLRQVGGSLTLEAASPHGTRAVVRLPVSDTVSDHRTAP